jgi:hypothetical protein
MPEPAKRASLTIGRKTNLRNLSAVTEVRANIIFCDAERHVPDKRCCTTRCVGLCFAASSLTACAFVLQRLNGCCGLHDIQVPVHVSDAVLRDSGSGALGIRKLNVRLAGRSTLKVERHVELDDLAGVLE